MITPPKKSLRLSLLGLSVLAATYGANAAASCTYVVSNEWNNGATAEIRITNTTSSPINGWNISWQYASDRITSSWNANLSGSNPYTATNLGWNGTIQPGQSVSFGFQVQKNGSSAEKPTINGAVCSGGNGGGVTPPPASSSQGQTQPSSQPSQPSSVPASSSSAPQNCDTSGQSCNWYGTSYPLCVTTASGWGYENNRSCITASTCRTQPSPYGVVGGNNNNCGTVPSSSSRPSSSAQPVPSSSSVAPIPSSSSRPSSSAQPVPSSSSAAPLPSSSSRSSSSAAPAPSSSSAASTPAVSGSVFRVNAQGQITKNGTVLPGNCGNWFGLEGRHEPSNDATNPSGAPMELYVGNMWWVNDSKGTGRTIQQAMTEMKEQGLTLIRLPIAPQTLDPNDPQGKEPNLKNHPSVRQTNARQQLEDFIKLADQNGLHVFIDIHACSNYVGWRGGRLDSRPPYVDATRVGYDFPREEYSCAETGNPNTVKYIHAYNKEKWLANLREIAGLPAKLGVDNIIGIDIFNEPYDYTWEEWKSLSEAAYQAISSVNPNLLTIVEGVAGTANTQTGNPADKVEVPHGSKDTNPNWGENLYEAGENPINIPKDRMLFSPHIYGPAVFVQKQHIDPTQTECEGLEGDEAGHAKCRVVIDQERVEAGWEEHFGYLRDLGYGMIIGEFGGNMDWPKKASRADQQTWSHITTNVDEQWQQAAVKYMKKRGIQGCYWGLNPESSDTLGWYLTPWDPISASTRWGEWSGFDPRRTRLLHDLWGK